MSNKLQWLLYSITHRELLHLEHSPAEWRLLEDLCKVLELCKDATTYLSVSSYPTLSVLGPVLYKIEKSLEEDESSPVMSRVKTAILDGLISNKISRQ